MKYLGTPKQCQTLYYLVNEEKPCKQDTANQLITELGHDLKEDYQDMANRLDKLQVKPVKKTSKHKSFASFCESLKKAKKETAPANEKTPSFEVFLRENWPLLAIAGGVILISKK